VAVAAAGDDDLAVRKVMRLIDPSGSTPSTPVRSRTASSSSHVERGAVKTAVLSR
jgi:predicted dinucleotide-binding enzyme